MNTCTEYVSMDVYVAYRFEGMTPNTPPVVSILPYVRNEIKTNDLDIEKPIGRRVSWHEQLSVKNNRRATQWISSTL